MHSVLIGNTNLLECPSCEGIWADTNSLQRICADREQQSAVLGVPRSLPFEPNKLEKIRYVPCPVCQKLMNRVAFARCSSVVVDVCKLHGTWFDRDELRRIVEFIRGGGLESARAQEMADLERKRQQLRAEQIGASWDTRVNPRVEYYDSAHGGIATVAANLITSFFFD